MTDDILTRDEFLTLDLRRVSYHDYCQSGYDLAATRELDELWADHSKWPVGARCLVCEEWLYVADYYARPGESYHAACWQVSHERPAEPTRLRSWRWHAHTADWAGAGGEIQAASEDDAVRKVRAWVDRQVELGDSDELGPYITVTLLGDSDLS